MWFLALALGLVGSWALVFVLASALPLELGLGLVLVWALGLVLVWALVRGRQQPREQQAQKKQSK